MNRKPLGRPYLAGGVIGLGILSLIYRDILLWGPMPSSVPASSVVAVLAGALLVVTGAGLLSPRFAPQMSRVLLALLLLCDVLFRIPPVVAAPLVEGSWIGLGMLSVAVVAVWLLTGMRGRRAAETIFGLALIPIGLSHFFYLQLTINLVPAWLPARAFWALLGGAGHVAAGLGVLFGVFPRLAAALEAAMITAFTVIVWIPGVSAHPGEHFQWTEFFASWIVGAAAWVVADSYAGVPWLSLGRRAQQSI